MNVQRSIQLSIKQNPPRGGEAHCDTGVTAGEITFSLVHEHGEEMVKDLKISAYLCDTSEMPPILGWHDFLSEGRLHIDYAANQASLELA